jgi:excisionase family DNA binding protein
MSETKKRTEFPKDLQFFSMAEAAIILGVSTRTVNDWIKEGILPVFRLGPKNRVIRIRRQDLDEFIEIHVRNQGAEEDEDV